MCAAPTHQWSVCRSLQGHTPELDGIGRLRKGDVRDRHATRARDTMQSGGYGARSQVAPTTVSGGAPERPPYRRPP
jgi:hypothetical protein